ncbi:MAG: two-component system sensor histidine kinase NtrB [Candidatus Krumholzibacteriia bacterium]
MWSAAEVGGATDAELATGETAAPAGAPGQLLALRLLFATFMVGTGIVVVRLATPWNPIDGLLVGLGLIYASVGAAWCAARRGVDGRRLAAWQLGADVLLIGLLCHVSGGAASHFRLLFFVPILLGASWLGTRGSVPLAASAALVTVLAQIGAAAGRVAGTAAPGSGPPGGTMLDAHFYVFLFLLVGLGGGLLADRAARREREAALAAADLRRARVEVGNVLDNLSSGLLIVDRQGRVVQLNPAAERILGVFAEEVAGRDLEEAFGASLAGFAETIGAVLAGGPTLGRGERNIVRWDTVVVPVGLSVSHLRDAAGEVSGAIAVFQDLTEAQRMRERVREADRLAAVGELSASIAHEIRNPLGSIRGSVEILAGELELTGHQARLLQLILKESARVNTIIDEFLAFARLRPARRRPVAVGALLDDVLLEARQQVLFKGGGVEVEARAAEPDLVVLVDAGQMLQLFLNLALNACEAMEYRGRLVVTAGPADAGFCELRVADTGPGLSDEARARLFTPFFTTKKHGTGLGLPMVARIAHAHEGTVEAAASPAGGAEFRVRVPLAPARDPAAPGDDGRAPGAAGTPAPVGSGAAGV